MTESEKILYAKEFIDKMKEGINPLDGTLIPDTDLLNNVRISRCMHYVSDLLREYYDYKLSVERKRERSLGTKQKKKTRLFVFPEDKLKELQPNPLGATVSEITQYVNMFIDETVSVKLRHKTVTEWLIGLQLLTVAENEHGKKIKIPTETGNILGITSIETVGVYGKYERVVYNEEAQRFIFDHLDSLAKKQNGEEE